ncbi:MAG TPA: hypothetical protein VEQ87_23735 [Burkholderiales bacterium]|nr:hypothetical protein [Burkholderiales bacterium]
MARQWMAAFAATVMGICSVPLANAQEVAGMFGKGRLHGIVTAGYGSAFGDDYAIFGAGVSYYLIDGLAIGGAFETWRGGDPTLSKLTFSTQYVFYQVPRIKPFIGAFYRRTFITGLDDLDSYGGRAGAYFQLGRNAYVGVAGVYESYTDCTDSRYRSCSDTYPEVTFTFAF